jgi:hypothetical protein
MLELGMMLGLGDWEAVNEWRLILAHKLKSHIML